MECSCGAYLRPDHTSCPQCGRDVSTLLAQPVDDRPVKVLARPQSDAVPIVDRRLSERWEDQARQARKAAGASTAHPKKVKPPPVKYVSAHVAMVPSKAGRKEESGSPTSYLLRIVGTTATGATAELCRSPKFTLAQRDAFTADALQHLQRLLTQFSKSKHSKLPRVGGDVWYERRFVLGVPGKTPVTAQVSSHSSVCGTNLARPNRPLAPSTRTLTQLPRTPLPNGGLRFVLPLGTESVRFELDFDIYLGARRGADGSVSGGCLTAVAITRTERRTILLATGSFSLRRMDEPAAEALAQLAVLRQVAVNTGLTECMPGPDEPWYAFTYEMTDGS